MVVLRRVSAGTDRGWRPVVSGHNISAARRRLQLEYVRASYERCVPVEERGLERRKGELQPLLRGHVYDRVRGCDQPEPDSQWEDDSVRRCDIPMARRFEWQWHPRSQRVRPQPAK